MQFKFQSIENGEIEIPIETGQVVFVIGSNGSGKSSLMQKLFAQNTDHAKKISSQRQNWFETDSLDLTPAAKTQIEQNMINHDRQDTARWKEYQPGQRASIAIFDLIESENTRARKITASVDSGDLKQAEMKAKTQAPLSILNGLLATANLGIEIQIKKDAKLVAVKNGGTPYSIAELSDGERNALLIGASILTADPGTLLIIDEPERHLHRSIISPLLLSLFETRQDCAFVISTHNVSLPMDSLRSSTVLVRSCVWNENSVSGWDVDLLEADECLTEEIKEAILGARRQILFIEGSADSLDRHIYTLLYPDLSVVPRGNCVNVERAVTGIRSSIDLHWVSSFGLIDRDNREQDEIQNLQDRGIFALDCYSVESLYYCNDIIKKVAERQQAVAEEVADADAAVNSIITEVAKHKDRLCGRLIEKKVRTFIARDLPTSDVLMENPIYYKRFDVGATIKEEQESFEKLIASSDTEGLVNRYPVRETGALKKVAEHLGFQSRVMYESAVRKLVVEDSDIKEMLRQKVKSLTDAIEG
ncbi:MAG: AAA family ATPase [Gammaproteobacteria bacterium]|nr:AAA family ATPase [Gammaproteobacteria bacterium]